MAEYPSLDSGQSETGEPITFAQHGFRVRLTGVAIEPPDTPLTTIAIECDAEPNLDTDFVRKKKPRIGI